MLLYEFDDSSSLRTRLVAVSAQLRSRIEKESRRRDFKPWTKDKLQDFLSKHDIILDDADLFDMVKKAPLKNIISNISDDEVQFRGIGNDDSIQTDKTADKKQNTVAKMAKSAMKSGSGPSLPPPPPSSNMPP